jgi:hypothetical protein
MVNPYYCLLVSLGFMKGIFQLVFNFWYSQTPLVFGLLELGLVSNIFFIQLHYLWLTWFFLLPSRYYSLAQVIVQFLPPRGMNLDFWSDIFLRVLSNIIIKIRLIFLSVQAFFFVHLIPNIESRYFKFHIYSPLGVLLWSSDFLSSSDLDSKVRILV